MKKLLFTALTAIMSLWLFAQSDILPPVMDKPANGATDVMPDVTLDWYAVTGVGVISYEVQLDSSSQFLATSPFFESHVVTTTSKKSEDLFFGHEYYWRVRSFDASGDTSAWSDIYNFFVFDQVDLGTPATGAINVMPDVRLAFNLRKGSIRISGVNYFDVEASLDSNFTAPVYFMDSVSEAVLPSDTTFFYARTNNLLFGTMYYWRVRARHETDTSLWSVVRNFTTIETVNILKPAQGAVNQMPDILLAWTDISGVDSYIYQLCSDPNFSFPCITGIISNDSVVVSDLFFGNEYYWRVRAANYADTTDWSDTRNFEVINTVFLTFPTLGDSTAGSLPYFEWQSIDGVSLFEMRLYNADYSYSDTIMIDTVNHFNAYIPLDSETEYFWKVRARKNGEISGWSDVWNFYTSPPQGVEDLVLVEDNISLYPNPTAGMLSINLNSIQRIDVRVEVSNLLGQTVYEELCSFEQGISSRTIDLTSFNDGLYLLRMQAGDKSYTTKIIIDK
ncbi:MAG: T9SS type A sorting domain-containing protein [Bacteroidales bacterium]